MCRIIILLLIFLITGSGGQLFSQKQNIYLPFRDYQPAESEFNELVKNFEADAREEIFKSSKVKKEFINSVDEHCKHIKEIYSDKRIMQNNSLSGYLNKILINIQKSNPELEHHKYLLFVHRDPVPNAHSYGEGLITFNLGLLERLESEAEAAFVICHELAHDYLKHFWKRARTRALLMHDKEFNQQLKRAIKQEFGSAKAVDSIVNKYIFRVMENTRENELQADSLGLYFYRRSGYPVDGAVSLLKKLDEVDELYFQDSIAYSSIFNFQQYPFNNSWLIPEDEPSWYRVDDLFKTPDSMKTHPGCDIRILKVNEYQKLFDTCKTINTGTVAPEILSTTSFTMVETLMEYGSYDLALYQSLQLLKNNPYEPYLHGSVVESLYYIWFSRKAHNFSYAVNLPNKMFPSAFNQLLYFQRNINSGINKKLINYYFNSHLTEGYNYEYFYYLITLIKSMDAEKAEYASIAAKYKEKYGESYYYHLICKQFNITI